MGESTSILVVGAERPARRLPSPREKTQACRHEMKNRELKTWRRQQIRFLTLNALKIQPFERYGCRPPPRARLPARHQVSALSREAAGAKEGEARAREELATRRSEAAAELDKTILAAREAEEQERSARTQLQVSFFFYCCRCWS